MNRLKSLIYAGVFACVAQTLLSPAHAQKFSGMTPQKCETALQSKLADLIEQSEKDIQTNHTTQAQHSLDILSDTLKGLKNSSHQLNSLTIGENESYFRGKDWIQLLEPLRDCTGYIPKRILDLGSH